MKLTEWLLIADKDDLFQLKLWKESHNDWNLLEQLPPDTRLTRTQIGWMIQYDQTCKHERLASHCVSAYFKDKQ